MVTRQRMTLLASPEARRARPRLGLSEVPDVVFCFVARRCPVAPHCEPHPFPSAAPRAGLLERATQFTDIDTLTPPFPGVHLRT